jgi:hypothetical protein
VSTKKDRINALSKADQFGKKRLARIAKKTLEEEKNHGD